MHTFQRWISHCLLLTSLIISLPASAYLKFTYTSDELPLTAMYIDGYPLSVPGIAIPPVSFSMSFIAKEQDLSLKPITHFFMDEFSFSFFSENDSLYYPLRLSPFSYGRVSLNREGEIAGWNLMLTITELITPDTDMRNYRMVNHRVDIVSRGGVGTCNCDVFTNRFHPTAWHGQWIQLALLQFDFSHLNNADNWTLEKISVPEPASAGLLLVGLLGLAGLRRYRSREYS